MIYSSFLAGNSTADHVTLNKAIAGGKPFGVFGAPSVEITDSQVTVEPMSALFPSGVFIYTDAPESVSAPTPAAAAMNYTLVWVIDPGLYQQPSLSVLSGVYKQDQVQDYVVIGWIYHPGSNLSFSTEMFVQAPRAGAPAVVADFDADAIYSKVLAANTATAALKITRTRDGRVSFASASDVQQTVTIPLLVPVREDVVQSLLVDLDLSSQAWVTWARVTQSAGIVTPTAIPYAAVSGELDRAVVLLPFARQVQAVWTVIALEMTLTLGPGASADIARVAATTLPTSSLMKL